MKKKLDISLIRIETLLVGKVNFMDNILRGKLDSKINIAGNTYILKSINQPQIYYNSLYLPGNYRAYDDVLMYYEYESVEKAKNVASAFKQLIDNVNEIPDKNADFDVEKIL